MNQLLHSRAGTAWRWAVLALGAARLCLAQADSQPAQPHAAAQHEAAVQAPAGILPLPDYGGEFATRRYLSGDWGGTRAELANKGIQFNLNWNQYVQGVSSGGRASDTEYGGKGDFLINFDLQRMGLLPGATLKVRAESRYGDSVNGAAGPILPVNTDASFPLTDRLDEGVSLVVTNVLYTQFLSEKFAVFLGKLDTLDGDPNEFASGRGTSQFMNGNFIFNSALALRLPYSTLGAGLVWLPTPNISVNSSIVNTVDSSTTSGFEDFGDGSTWTTEVHVQYRLGGLPGGQNAGFLYSFDQDFTKLGGRFIFEPGEGLTLPNEEETWAVYWSGWQYLYVEDPSDAPINLANGQADHKGVGLFARLGFADRDTNPVEWSISGGLGGRGIIPSRGDDTFGVGYYYSSIQPGRLSGITGTSDQAQGVEAFYNIAVTPAAHLTLDAQFVQSPASSIDDAVVLGLRLGLTF